MSKVLKLLLVSLSIYFIFFTFYGLNWGAPFYFHPDERNIASSISQLKFESLNPKFFAYGQLPIYAVFLLGSAQNFFTNGFTISQVTFEQAIFIGRFISAVLTVLLVYLIYKVTVQLKNKEAGILALIFSTTSVAFFQFSHFATFEIWLSFFYLLAAYVFLKFINTKKIIYFAIGSVIFGMTCGLKLSSLAFFLIPFYLVLITTFEQKNIKLQSRTFIKLSFILTVLSLVAYALTSPFNLIDSTSFINSMRYESSVANGSLPVFYTGSFIGSIPIIFQYLRVLPFIINPVLTIIFLPAILYLSIKNKRKEIGLFILAFFTLFISGSFLFAKWTRYIIPAIPFLYILVSIAIINIVNKKSLRFVFLFFAIIGVIFSFSFLSTVRLKNDTRLEALNFAQKNIKKDSNIISEVYDLGIVPFNPFYPKIILFNFYDLDNGNAQKEALPNILEQNDYIILPSQRIVESRISHPKEFPVANKFYSDLFEGKLGFLKIYETPCDVLCQITYIGNPVFGIEQTSNVFDRPTVYIFKKK